MAFIPTPDFDKKPYLFGIINSHTEAKRLSLILEFIGLRENKLSFGTFVYERKEEHLLS